jgi:hypothetical protein
MKKIFLFLKEWGRRNFREIFLFLLFVFLSLFSFALGYLIAIFQNQAPLRIESGL